MPKGNPGGYGKGKKPVGNKGKGKPKKKK